MYKKKTIFTVIATVLFVTNLANINNVNFNHSQTVQAATKKLGTLKLKEPKRFVYIIFQEKLLNIMLRLIKNILILLRNI